MSKIEKAFKYLMSDNRSPKSATAIQKRVGNSTAIGSIISDLRKKPWNCDIKHIYKGTNPNTDSQINFYEILSFSSKLMN